MTAKDYPLTATKYPHEWLCRYWDILAVSAITSLFVMCYIWLDAKFAAYWDILAVSAITSLFVMCYIWLDANMVYV